MTPGLFISSEQKISFNFDGRTVHCFAGDTVASALWRNGIKTLSRSFKYRRRRGILSLSGADAHTLMNIDGAPNVLADRIQAAQDMIARSRRYGGNSDTDYLSFLQYLSPVLPPGFYYKAFFKPRGAWLLWEPVIRKLAGLGEVNPAAEPVHVEKIHDFCDVAVIGGGPAGIAAALAAVQKGHSVRLLDRNPMLGGSLNWRGSGQHRETHVQLMEKETKNNKNIRTVLSCEVTGVFADNFIIANCPQHSLRVRAKQIIYATGARDTPAVFANNDLPGIMLTSAALRLAFLYDLACGRRAVMLAACEEDANAARALQKYGVAIAAVFNIGEQNAKWADALSADGFVVHHKVSEFAATGRESVSGVRTLCDGRRVEVSCDCILMNGGSMPTAELPASAGIPFEYDSQLHKPVGQNDSLAGAVNNRATLESAIADGKAAGGGGKRPNMDDEPAASNVFFACKQGKAFVDFEEDLQLCDLDDAIDEGFNDIQLLKRYTTAGMGPAQGKLGNVLIQRHLAARTNHDTRDIGQITARPPAAPETLAQLAHEPQPVKHTALHRTHTHLSASFMPAGPWLRPAYYTNAEEEANAVRNNAGIVDISTLGKILIVGKDAAEFLERLYTGRFAKQKPGFVRYALMLDEAGIIADDGVAARLDEERFWVTTTTGNADAIYRQMLLWRARWQMQVDVVNMTSAYAAMNLAGPNAPEILSALTEQEIDLAYMRATEVSLCGTNAILMRVGFVGEKGFEIHLPSGHAAGLWNILLEKATPFGVEAQRLLRLEKGHIIVGQDTDGLTTPLEADMEWALGRDKEFYLGQRALSIHRQRGILRQLRGFTVSPQRRRISESDLVLDRKGQAVGRVTSVSYSPTLQKVVGLAHAPVDTPATGGILRVRAAGGEILEAQTQAPPFYDPDGDRQK